MKSFSNNRTVKIKDIIESGMYDPELINALTSGRFNYLADLPVELRGNIDYMEPLLYAVRNELGTYNVYQYYTESLQDNEKLASEIIVEEPDLIAGTPVSKNEEFILNNVKTNPKILQYMSPELKSSGEMLEKLNSIDSREVTKEIARSCDIKVAIECNASLSDDKDFMAVAIERDLQSLEYASDNLKNDYEFLKTQSSKQEKVIDYVVDNMNDFGLEGIKGVRESSKDFTVDDCLGIINEMAENSDDERYKKVKQKVMERGIEDVHTVRWVTAMVAQDDNISPESVNKILNYSMLTMEKTRKSLTKSGEMEINQDNMQELITPLILNRLKGKLQAQNIDIDKNLQKKLDEYTKFYDEYHEKFKEQKMKNRKEKLTPKDVEQATEDVRSGEINSEIQEIKEKVTEERESGNNTKEVEEESL